MRILQSGFDHECISIKKRDSNPTMEQIKEYLSGNLCRCTGYQGQYRALAKYFGVEE